MQRVMELRIPQEYHRFILGKGGKDLTDLATRTDTKIYVPKQTDNSDLISVSGVREACEEAIAAIKATYEEKVWARAVN